MCSNGDVYAGNFKNHKRNGNGELKTHRGLKYDGEWLNGKYHGDGVLVLKNGFQYNGKYRRYRITLGILAYHARNKL